MNRYDMIAFVVLVVMIATVLRAWITARSHRARDAAVPSDAETERLRGEVQQLRDRIAVLERIAVDKEHSLAREIEGLREG